MSTIRTKTSNSFKKLNFDGTYYDFNDFYGENKTEIYKSIIEIFTEFKKSKKKNLNLHISAKIKGLDWDTDFIFNRSDTIILTRDIIPYFESIENYEFCSEIYLLNKELTN
jgi:hypothetical protein